MQKRVHIVSKGDLRKTKLLKDKTGRFFFISRNQIKFLRHYRHTNPQGRTESRNVKHWCPWQIILAVGMNCSHLLLLRVVQKCLQMMQWEVQTHVWNLPQKPTFIIWNTKHSPWALCNSAVPMCQHGDALVVKMTRCPVVCGTGKCDLSHVSAGLQQSAWIIG